MLEILPGHTQDAPSIREINNECFPGWQERHPGDDGILRLLRLGYSFVAIVDGRMAGFVLVDDQSGFHPEDRFITDPECKHVGPLGVLSKYRRQGVGRKLMERVHELHRHTTLQVLQENVAAKQLYRSMGYATILFDLKSLKMERWGN